MKKQSVSSLPAGRLRAAGASVAFLTTVGVALTGCSSADPASPEGDATVSMFMWTSSQAEADAWTEIGDLVTEKYPEITVDFQTADWANYWTKLVADAAGGSDLCVVGVQNLRLPGVADLLVPLDDQLDGAGIDLGEFDETIVDSMQVDGAQKVVPFDAGPLVVYYNKDAFAAAGLEEPAEDWTLEDFEATMAALTTAEQYGFIFYPNADYSLPLITSISGKQAVNEDGELALTDPDYVAAFDHLAQYVYDRKQAPEVPAGAGWALDEFISGNVAMAVDGPWNFINAASSASFELGIAPIPAGDAGQRTVSAGSGFGIAQSCSNQEAAVKALSVITGADAQEKLATAGRAFPARTAQQDAWYANVDEQAKAALEYSNGISEPQRLISNWTGVVDGFTQYGVEAVNGQASVESFLSTVQDQVK